MKVSGILGVSLIGILLSLSAQAKLQTLAIQAPAVYDQSNSIPQRVITECTKLPGSISKTLARLIVKDDYARVRGIDTVGSTTPGKALALRIIKVDARPGGMYSGPKILTVRAALYQDGTQITWDVFSNYNRGNPIGAFNNCSILQAEANKIASNIFHWLQATQGKRKLPETLVRVEPPVSDDASSVSKPVASEKTNEQSAQSTSTSSSAASESK